MLLVIFLLPVAEILIFIEAIRIYGFANVFFAVVLGAILGFGIVRTQGAFLLRRLPTVMQTSAGQPGAGPDSAWLHSFALFMGGVFIMVPGFLTDVVGLLLVLPGTRHLLVRAFRRKLNTAFAANGSGFRVFTSSTFGGFYGAAGGFSQTPSATAVRDVSPFALDHRSRNQSPATHSSDVIDVTAVNLDESLDKNEGPRE